MDITNKTVLLIYADINPVLITGFEKFTQSMKRGGKLERRLSGFNTHDSKYSAQ